MKRLLASEGDPILGGGYIGVILGLYQGYISNIRAPFGGAGCLGF